MELLQHELDLAKAALLNLSPAPVPNEVARRPTGFDGVVQPTGAAGCGAAAEPSQAAPLVIEAAEDVVARAQAMMEEAMTAAQEITTKASTLAHTLSHSLTRTLPRTLTPTSPSPQPSASASASPQP